jgi:hypothetical protein
MENTEAIWQQRLAKRREGTPWKNIIEAEGFEYGGTFTRHLKIARARGWIPPEETLPPARRSDGKRVGLTKPKPAQETPMSEDVVEVLPGHPSIDDADTAAPEVHYDTVGEFDALPEGYAKVIQPMREHNEAEDAALQESVRLFGFIGTIVRDQYGRILDGNQRARVARVFGTGCPYTIFHVNDDAHAIEVAMQLNLARRHMYTPEQRQQIALALRDKGGSYRYIAAALGVSKDTVQRDIFGGFKIIAASEPEIVSPETIPVGTHGTIVASKTISTMEPPTPAPPSPPVKRVQRKGGGTYPAQRPATTTPKAPAPESTPPPRKRVQDGLVALLKMIPDQTVWPILGELALQLDTYAERLSDPDLQQRMEQALSPLWHLIEDHEATISHTSEPLDSPK